MMKRNDGFTLVEMLVSIIAGTLATAAVATLLLLGMRMNAKTSEIATQDNQALICLSVMEEMVKSNEVVNVTNNAINIKDGDTPKALFTYNATDNSVEVSTTGVKLLENVADCKFEINGNLLTIKLQLDEDEEPFVKTIRLVTGQTITLS